MTKTFKGLEGVCRLLILATFLVLMGAVLLQVYARTFLSTAPVWTEELTRFCLLYIGALGAGLALRSGDMVNVDLLCESLPGRMPWFLRLVSAILTVVFAAVLCQPHGITPRLVAVKRLRLWAGAWISSTRRNLFFSLR